MNKNSNSRMNDLIANTLAWGEARGLHSTMDLRPQLVKLIEELGEIAAGVARNDNARILDGVGDLLVVLLQFGAVHSKSVSGLLPQTYLEDCLDLAYTQIAKRTGRTEGGIFVKDDPTS